LKIVNKCEYICFVQSKCTCKWCLRLEYWHNIRKLFMKVITKCFWMFHLIVFCEWESWDSKIVWQQHVIFFDWNLEALKSLPIQCNPHMTYCLHNTLYKNIVIFIDLDHGAWYLWIHVTPKFGLASSCFKCPFWLYKMGNQLLRYPTSKVVTI